MLNIRTVILSIMLVFILMLIVREAVAIRVTTLSTNAANQSAFKRKETLDCFSLPSRYSIHTGSVKTIGTLLTYTEDGPTGIDGGLIYLLSSYRTCLRSGE